jgi:peptidoglycan/xylan/chitin deacetylase (PgdA/CDA1 family)
MAGSRVPGSINLRPIDAGTSVLSFSPPQGTTGGAHDSLGPDQRRYLAAGDGQTKDAPRAAPPPARRRPGDGISLQITIDDAPGGSATNDAMLDLLDKYKIKTMFFIEGQFAEKRVRDLRKLVDRGHHLGNHTWDHPQLTKKSDDEIKRQLARTDELVKKLTGKSMAPNWRPPYGDGFRDARVLRAAAAVGFTKMWYWDIDSEDWNILTGPAKHRVARPQAEINKLITDKVEQQLTALIRNPQPGREGEKGKYVVLVHDKPTTVAALEVLLPRLKSEGYTFVDFP